MGKLSIGITGIRIKGDTDFTRSFAPMAFIDFKIEPLGIEVRGSTLARRDGRFIVRQPREVPAGGVKFDWQGPLSVAVASRAVDRYIALGGPLPSEFIPLRDLDFSGIDEGLSNARRAEIALERERKITGNKALFTEKYELDDDVLFSNNSSDGEFAPHRLNPVIWERCQNAN